MSVPLKPGDLVTLHMPHGPLKLVVRDVIRDPRGEPYVRASDPTDTTVVVRREWMFTRGWPK